MMSKVGAYADELRFALSAASDLRSVLRLVGRTLDFHLNNAAIRFGLRKARSIAQEDAFDICIDLGFGVHRVWLRVHAGDLFVFYEVLGKKVYDINDIAGDRKVANILDLGANIGMASLAFHARYPSAKILAVEPLAANYALLCRNTQGIRAITPVRAAVVGEPTATVRLTTGARAWGNRLARSEHAEERTEEVPARTILELLDEHGIEKVDLLKIDIEGAEAELFAEPSFLSRVDLVLVELHPPYDITALERDVAPAGFAVLPPDPKAGRAVPIVLRARGYVP